MEGDSENAKISYFYHWINGEGISKIEGWKNNKIFISQSDYDALPNKEGKYSSDKIESYFTLFELSLTPRSNPLLAVEDLYLAKKRLYDFWRISLPYTQNCKKMSIPMPKGRGKSHQGCYFHGYE